MKYSGEQTFANNSCVFVCFLPSYSGRQIRRKYKPGSHRKNFIHLPSAVHAFIFLARRIQPFFSVVNREVELKRNPSYRNLDTRSNVSEGYEVAK